MKSSLISGILCLGIVFAGAFLRPANARASEQAAESLILTSRVKRSSPLDLEVGGETLRALRAYFQTFTVRADAKEKP
jgi:hypothetical protein